MSKKETLKINEIEPGKNDSIVRISSRALYNGLTFRPFRFLVNYSDQNSDQLMARAKKYRDIKLYRGKRWWVQYWYRVPKDLQHLYKGKQWEKFRVFEDINRYKTDDFAALLITSVKFGLDNGFDPFEYAKAVQAAIDAKLKTNTVWTISEGLNLFLTEWADRGNEPETLVFYTRAVGLLHKWLTARKLQNNPLQDLKRDWVKACLDEAAKQNKESPWSGRTYNNNLALLRTVFNFLVREEKMTRSPGAGISLKKTKSEKHKYYDPKKFESVRKLMLQHDPMLHFATKLIYYLCIRSVKELRNFRIGDIYLDRRQVLVHADSAKTDKDRYIAIPDELYPELELLKEKHPDHFFVISPWHIGNKAQPENRPGPKKFGKNFITKRYGKIRKLADLSEDYTPYSFKHTRIIHLKQDGAKDQDIIQLTGHETYEAYAQYLRDLGVDGDPAAINKVTRTF